MTQVRLATFYEQLWNKPVDERKRFKWKQVVKPMALPESKDKS